MKAYITNRIYLMLFFCSITIMAQAQQKFEISGIVQDETGQPVPGVSVYVKDKTGIGTNTDMDGKFVLKVDRGDKVQFSFIGYARHEYLALKTEKKLVIQLVPDVSALDEVVVEAYGSKTRKIPKRPSMKCCMCLPPWPCVSVPALPASAARSAPRRNCSTACA